ncbi:MAG: uroporphyrinogen decarboxylase family protein [Victivallaceae bacterium]|nr:uroporphyrinogen decarboxylase family protein [Victivallaceae bacterium]
MTSKEIVRRTVKFKFPERPARSLPPEYGSDFAGIGMDPSVDQRPSGKKGRETDEWGAVWENIGVCRLGEVKDYPLKSWEDWDKLQIPDVNDPRRWKTAESQARNQAEPDKFVLAGGISLYERIHFIRGLENTWTDIYLEPDNLNRLIGCLTEMNLKAIEHYRQLGVDGYMFCDDWGLQDKLMIDPEKWREFWQPAYRKVYRAAHDAGMLTFLHSCGYIVEILDGLIDAGLDVIQMDQQQNMGLDLLSERFRGRITFWCPVDIQNIMCTGSPDEIRAYVREMFRKLSTPAGGFIAGYYTDPAGAGHSPTAIQAMCSEFSTLTYPDCA